MDTHATLSAPNQPMPLTSERPHRAGLGSLLFLVVITGTAAVLGALSATDTQQVYAILDKPSWAPPASVFGPAWSFLYALMAIAAWLGIRKCGWRRSGAFTALYVSQLAANAIWSPLFFTIRSGLAATIDAIVLWLLVLGMMRSLRRLRPLAGWMVLPYLAWVTYAVALTVSVWRRNPTLL
jgi:tryptophan-rich sensory protein